LGSTVRPNRSAAQAFEPDISAKNRPETGNDSVDSQRDFFPHPSLRGAERRSNPDLLCGPMDCFASLAMTE
jgi:hypothetical protein